MIAADGWGRSVVYETIGGAFVLILFFILDAEGGLDSANFSLIRERHSGRLNASKDTESTTARGVV